MQQPELGRRLTALRKEKNLTQEELVAKSNVSVRTIQRIEAGEVLPRVITVKILLEALGETYQSFSSKQHLEMEQQENIQPNPHQKTLLLAVLAGSVYLAAEIILGTMDIAWLSNHDEWGFKMYGAYISLTVLMVASYVLFARGFIALASIFENTLLKAGAYLLVLGTLAGAILDISTLSIENVEDALLPYAGLAVLLGTLSIVFGVGLLRLQDGMGELSKMAGILEIVMGCLLITVVLFFVSYVVMIPAVVLEILVLYRGYEYVSKSEISAM
jgi:transcriptional regulator with XRE-family HTH domain